MDSFPSSRPLGINSKWPFRAWGGDRYVEADEIATRTAFRESYMWMVEFLPPCPQDDPHWWDGWNTQLCDSILGLIIPNSKTFSSGFSKTTSSAVSYKMQDSITNWEIIGISLSQTHGELIVYLFTLFPRHSCFLLAFRHLCDRSTGGLRQKAVLHRPQTAVLCCRWGTAGNKGRPPQLHPRSRHREPTLPVQNHQVLTHALPPVG